MRDSVKGQAEAGDYDAWFRQEVDKALASADAGLVLESEEVERRFAARRAETLRKIGNQ
ncbi:hypothetical protein [Variibacter gotjawalensis]|uniref:hypothetical protein n=1 Tax=Variibacter gotjawalensis TaxID=1333996 RepID=UPI0010EDDB80|nr:hypothetical protein [Variibacter gotjawalensis]NIK46769.1 putative transcriptional regulator [Variibacter gotjawalensis]RZS48673.1 hypothetical protein EV661_1088 [Variibacter gotjawalensis]